MTIQSKFPSLRAVVAFAALAGAASFAAQAQTVPLLDCSAGQSTASLTVETSTAWQQSNDAGTTWGPTAAASNGGWGTAPDASIWIGDGAGGQPPSSQQYRLQIQAGSGIDFSAPLSVSTSFLADDTLAALTLNGSDVGASGGSYTGTPTTASGSVTLPAAGIYPIVASVTNTGGAYGLALSMTITATCKTTPPPAAIAVPVDAPWALGGLAGLVAVVAGAAARRRKRG